MEETSLQKLLLAKSLAVLRLVAPAPNPRGVNSSIRLNSLQPDYSIKEVQFENVFYVEIDPAEFRNADERKACWNSLVWLMTEKNGAKKTDHVDQMEQENGHQEKNLSKNYSIEIGPRLNFKTSFCTNALSITESLGYRAVKRIEKSKLFTFSFSEKLDAFIWSCVRKEFREHFMDPVLECEYDHPIDSFHVHIPRILCYEIPVLENGRAALLTANSVLSLGFDEDDIDFYTNLFVHQVKRNPTNVECLDLAQSNSEHSRHWFFNATLTVDGKEIPQSLFRMVKNTQQHTNQNNVIKFSDNSSAIVGYNVEKFTASNPAAPSHFVSSIGKRHIIFTAETHNFPTAVEPFSGSTTGTGGRIRDVQATGRGAHVIAGTAGYSFGNCHIPDYSQPWEEPEAEYPKNFAHPLKVIIEASNGASDYGNKFGEPLICGFARSFGARLPNGERREWVKPIMFSGGIGSIDEAWIKKLDPSVGMDVVKIGGPVYRIGLGGGAASSTVVQGSNDATVDFNAVQRGDAEMEQKLNRVIRSCIELDDNPIVSIHDQGAGGNANVLKEIVYPAGAVIKADNFSVGDETLSIHELWVAEYQESNATLILKEKTDIVKQIAARERCPVDIVGEITGSGMIELKDFSEDQKPTIKPVELELDLFLGSIPAKKYVLDHVQATPKLTNTPKKVTTLAKTSFLDVVEQVLQLPAVASKRYLTNKVDRSVTGLIAQQQCVGPFHTPLADVAVIALSAFNLVGSATAIGEQPIKMLFDVKRGARLSVVEALTNLMFAKISCLRDVKCSGNWMWPAKLPGEGAALYDACDAMCGLMNELGIAIDGGKDSLSMAAKCAGEVVKAPGTLVISAYAPCPDVRKKVTPDLKVPNGRGRLFWIDLSKGHHRLQGSAYAQVFNAYAEPWEVADLESADDFVKAFETTQNLISDGRIRAGHDISDGGLVVCLLEMAIAGNAVFNVRLDVSAESESKPEQILLAEEVGWVLESDEDSVHFVIEAFEKAGIHCHDIGYSSKILNETGVINGETVHPPFIRLNDKLVYGAQPNGIAGIRSIWEEFSHQIELLQCDPDCAKSEKAVLLNSQEPKFTVSFKPEFDVRDIFTFISTNTKPKVAIIREEGSNGDREMAAAFHLTGFEAWDINVQDMLDEKVTLDRFRGAVFVGGFSYADVFGSAKGWAAVLASHISTRNQMEQFFRRSDTFSLGVCNGCQLLALLGVVGHPTTTFERMDIERNATTLHHNSSGRFDSRFSTVRIPDTKSIMLKDMKDTQLGIWVAHGEGKFSLNGKTAQLREAKCISLEYVDHESNATEEYPLNPNGSTEGVAGICSADGRHLAMMPHPERTVLCWQLPWWPENVDWPKDALFSPWIKMFRNAFEWCSVSA